MTTERTVEWVVCEMSEEMKGDFEKQVNQIMDQKEPHQFDLSYTNHLNYTFTRDTGVA